MQDAPFPVRFYLAADDNGDGGRAGHSGQSADPAQRRPCRDGLLRGKHSLPHGQAGLCLPGQRTKLPGARQGILPGGCPCTEFCQSRFQPGNVLRRVFRGEHQHKVARVGIFALRFRFAADGRPVPARSGPVPPRPASASWVPGRIHPVPAAGPRPAAASAFRRARRAQAGQYPQHCKAVRITFRQDLVAFVQRLQDQIRRAGGAKQRQCIAHSSFVLNGGVFAQMQVCAPGDNRQRFVAGVAAHGRAQRNRMRPPCGRKRR